MREATDRQSTARARLAPGGTEVEERVQAKTQRRRDETDPEAVASVRWDLNLFKTENECERTEGAPCRFLPSEVSDLLRRAVRR